MRVRTASLNLFIVGALLTLTASASEGQRRAAQPYLIELQGYLGVQRDEPKGTTEFSLRHRDKTYRFHLAKLRVLVGNISPSSLLFELEPYRTNINLRGAQAMVERLDGAAGAESVTVTGYLRRGSRDLMVSEVSVVGAKDPAPENP